VVARAFALRVWLAASSADTFDHQAALQFGDRSDDDNEGAPEWTAGVDIMNSISDD
jgi:hypothetical protein